jgi:hypothetical protein
LALAGVRTLFEELQQPVVDIVAQRDGASGRVSGTLPPYRDMGGTGFGAVGLGLFGRNGLCVHRVNAGESNHTTRTGSRAGRKSQVASCKPQGGSTCTR